jgi:hypothetical protein
LADCRNCYRHVATLEHLADVRRPGDRSCAAARATDGTAIDRNRRGSKSGRIASVRGSD